MNVIQSGKKTIMVEYWPKGGNLYPPPPKKKTETKKEKKNLNKKTPNKQT